MDMRKRILEVGATLGMGKFKIPVFFGVSNCGTKASVALRAPDVLRVRAGIRSGGLWPAHCVAPKGKSKQAIVEAYRKALHKALKHEGDENLSVAGVRMFDPHHDGR